MIINFNIFDEAQTPTMTLHNPNGDQVGNISEFKDLSVSPKMTEISSLAFSVPYDKERAKYVYDKLVKKRIVDVYGFGKFEIVGVSEENDGVTRWKHIECNSIEVELTYPTISLLEGVYKFYDPTEPKNTIMGEVMRYIPNWTIGSVDSELWNTKRIFDNTNEGLYGFLMGTVKNTFDCLFLFDVANRVIHVKKFENATKNTDIIVGYNNLVKKVEISEQADSVVTCLNVYGANDISIHEVNPLGTSRIYNYSYYLNYKDSDGKRIMSEGLRQAIINWESKIQASLLTYQNLINGIKVANSELVTLRQELTQLENEYKTLETLYKVKYEQGLSTTETWNQMNTKQSNIEGKKIQLENKQVELEGLLNQKKTINQDLSPNNVLNFTIEQQKELALFTIEDKYVDEHLLTTDNMTDNEKMEVYQELYDKAQGILSEVSQVKYEFNTSLVNYIMLSEYKKFTQQTELGCVIKLELEKGEFAYPILMGYTINFDEDKRSSVEMNWSNTLRLKNDGESIKDMLSKAISGGNKVGLDSYKWSEYKKDKGSISEYINGTLDCSKQDLVNASNQEMLINENGMKLRKWDETTGLYSPKQAWWINNTLAYTKNNWETIESAFGEIQLPDGTKAYGFVGDAIVGRLLISSQLHIENESNTFRVNTNGASLLNADFTIENARNKLLLSPNDGIKVQKKNGTLLEDTFYLDATTGDLVMKGTIYATNGSFTGDINASTISGGEIIGATFSNGSNFTVDVAGNVEARSIKILGGSLDAANMTIKNLVVGENVTMGANAVISWANVDGKPNDLAYLDDIPTTLEIQNITGTTITDKLVSSPRILGADIEGGRIRQTTSQTNIGNVLMENGRMYLTDKSDSIKGVFVYDTSLDSRFTNKVYLQSNGVPLRIESVGSDMGLLATGKIYLDSETVISKKCTFLGEVYGCNVVFG